MLLSREKPWGLILFKRNIKSIIQIKKLIKEIKTKTKDEKFPILIDEEGLNVSRLESVFSHKISANFFGNLYEKDKDFAIFLYKEYLKSLCTKLKKIE